MIRQLLEKWFGLDPIHCETCEVLREQLHRSEAERRELLMRILDKDKSEPPPVQPEEYKPVGQTHVPWRVRQQMLEAEDRKAAQLMKAKQAEMKSEPRTQEIAELEKELGIQ